MTPARVLVVHGNPRLRALAREARAWARGLALAVADTLGPGDLVLTRDRPGPEAWCATYARARGVAVAVRRGRDHAAAETDLLARAAALRDATGRVAHLVVVATHCDQYYGHVTLEAVRRGVPHTALEYPDILAEIPW